MIQLFDLRHVLPFYSVSRELGWLLNGICVYTIPARLLDPGSRESIDLTSEECLDKNSSESHGGEVELEKWEEERLWKSKPTRRYRL